MTAFDLYTVGHSNVAAERFIAMLRAQRVSAIADVRSAPVSRFCPWFSAKNLAPLLAREEIGYLPYGEALGGRPRDPELYCDGVADYEAMARRPQFEDALTRLIADAARCRGAGRLCLLCAEREPLDCHRCLLLAPALAARGLSIGHIMHDGAIEPQAATERRLLELAGDDGNLFVTGQHDRLAAAYRRRSRAVAYRIRKN